MKQKLREMKGSVVKITVLFRYISIPISMIDRTSRQEKIKDLEDLNHSLRQPGVHLWNTLPDNSRIHFLFKYTENIY